MDVEEDGILLLQSLSQGGVEGVNGSVPVGDGVVEPSVDFEFDDGLDFRAGVRLTIDGAESDQPERVGKGAECLACEDLEGSLGTLEHVAFIFELLDSLEELDDGGVSLVESGNEVVEFGFLELGGDRGSAGLLGQKKAALIAYDLRLAMLVRRGLLVHRVDVNPALVGERTLTDVGLTVVVVDVGDLAQEA